VSAPSLHRDAERVAQLANELDWRCPLWHTIVLVRRFDEGGLDTSALSQTAAWMEQFELADSPETGDVNGGSRAVRELAWSEFPEEWHEPQAWLSWHIAWALEVAERRGELL